MTVNHARVTILSDVCPSCVANPKTMMKTDDFPVGDCVYPCNHMGICDHCGTVSNSVELWTDFEIEGCECLCHKARKLFVGITKKTKGRK